MYKVFDISNLFIHSSCCGLQIKHNTDQNFYFIQFEQLTDLSDDFFILGQGDKYFTFKSEDKCQEFINNLARFNNSELSIGFI